MKTKIFSLFLMLIMSIGTLFASATQVNGIWYDFNRSTLTADVTYKGENYYSSSDEYLGDIVIPESVMYNGNNYIVTSIGKGAFRGCSRLSSVTIPNSVTNIDEYAFYGCSGLYTIKIGNGVISIEKYAFYGCTGLHYVTIHSNAIMSAPYSSDSNLKNIFGEQVTNYIIGNEVTSIGEYAFYNCTKLTSVTIGSGVTSIGKAAFEGCKGLAYVHISDIATWCNILFANSEANPLTYAHRLYLNKELITNLTIPNNVTSIGKYAFVGCQCLTSVEIPNSVTSIEDYAFDRCSGLTSVTIPSSITDIGRLVFYYCSSLKSVTIPSSVISIGESAFHFCSGLTSVEIPNSVTSIGNFAFCACTGLTSVTIPNSVTSTGKSVFSGCTGLTSVTIPNGVTSIGSGTFSGCTSLTSVTIPNSVTSIGSGTFSGCTGLMSIEIPNSVKSIESCVFDGCTGLTSVTIPNGVTSIGNYAFRNCTGLTSVTCFASSAPTLYTEVWWRVDVSKISLYVPANSIDAYKSAYKWKDFASISPISAQETETSGIQTTSTENTVDISWPAVTGAASYELVIKDAGGNKICTLVFNANGQLVSLVFHAPARNNAPQQLQETGFVFTVTGLEPGKEYTYTFTATNNSGDVLRTESGTFYTNGTQGIEDVQTNNVRSTKVAKDGQIFILRGDKTYTLQGQEIK